ncbi:retrovirus-related pol polyprotein from transposon TNT 1-94 [Tanacetum coccineum]
MKSTDAPSPAKRSKTGKVTKKCMPKSFLQLVDEVVDEGVPNKEPTHDDEEAYLQRALEISLNEQGERTQGPARPVVIREPDSRRIQLLPEVQGKGKEKRRTPMPTKLSKHVDSPFLDAELALTDSETESEEEVPVIKAGDQDEGQAGPNPGEQDEGQAGSNPGDAAESQPQPSHVVHAGPNLEHMDLETTDASTQQKPEQMDEDSTGTLSSLQNLDKDLSFTDQFFVEKPQEEEPGKTNAEAEVQSMVSVPIHQDTSSVPPMTTPVIDLTKLYKLENLNIPHQVSKAIDEIVTDAVDWAMQAPLRARYFRNLPNPLQKSVELEYSITFRSPFKPRLNQEEARKKKRKRRKSPRTPPRSPPTQPPLPPPPVGVSGAPGTSGASRSSQFLLPLPPSTGTSGSTQQQGINSPTDYLMHDDSIPEEQVLLSNDEDSENDHQPKADMRKDWWKPLPEEERPATPEPTWTIPSSNKSDAKSVEVGAAGETVRDNASNFEGQAYEVVKAFYLDVIHLQFQIEECHKMLTAQVDWTNPEGDQYLRYGSKGSNPALSISKMKAASYLDFGLKLLVPEQMWIDDVCTYDISAKYGISHWWFNRQKLYIDRHDSSSCRKVVRTHMRILSVVKIKAYSRYGYDYLSKIVLRRADFQEHTIAKKDFKNMYPSDFEDLNLLLLQGHLDHLPGSDKWMLSTALNLTKPGWDATGYEFKHDYTIIESPRAVVFPVNNNERKIMRFNEIYKFSDGTLTRILEALDYRVKEFKVKRLNPGMNTRFWTEKDVTRSKEFIAAIERRLKTRRIYQNLECFVGGRVRDIDYRLLQRTE